MEAQTRRAPLGIAFDRFGGGNAPARSLLFARPREGSLLPFGFTLQLTQATGAGRVRTAHACPVEPVALAGVPRVGLELVKAPLVSHEQRLS